MTKSYTKKELESLILFKAVEIKELEEEIRELKETHEKAIKLLESNKDYYLVEMGKVKAELEQIHLVLDTVANPIPREIKYGTESWEVSKLSTLTRLAAWFASF